jgi:hypothetical protein
VHLASHDAKLGAKWFATPLSWDSFIPKLHAVASENIIRSKELLLKIQRLPPLSQGASGIADDDERGADVAVFAALCQHHGRSAILLDMLCKRIGSAPL